MTISAFNNLDRETAAKELFSCCGSKNWISLMMNFFPIVSETSLAERATAIWYRECDKKDWLEAFTHHPKIGDKKRLSEKFAGKEQAGVISATEGIIEALAKANADYEKKFGFIFIICATGKSAAEMLRLLNDRLKNDRDAELNIAMGEQHKITILRLKKLFDNVNFQFLNMSQITTHVLDTSAGKPGIEISVWLTQKKNESWKVIAQGVTNNDGRVTDLLAPGKTFEVGTFKLIFDTGNYYTSKNIKTFYPVVEIQFSIVDESHYHVPLLISPFGYSTYRGS